MNLGQNNPWETNSIARGNPSPWSPTGDPSAQRTRTTSVEWGSACSPCCAGGRLGHEAMQNSRLRAGGTARAGAGGRSVLQHQAPHLLHPLITIWKCLFWNTDVSPAQQGQRPCHGETPSHHKDRHHQCHKGTKSTIMSTSTKASTKGVKGGKAGINHPHGSHSLLS